ncbi:uncharacterized protein BXZ73DRAFT_101428 [Epithele typhae]|uniref:uncharacterized protein n=1 Tax=Epithele typhae TaxID=378194 RepID=UPI00200787AD|nr:uncharacterized protein BXZ73DRAFT_101428 [Epithele typhae]KAH9932053.1 hypothetical protein BXZ73DRAFT_101428 [Epithele typhae]
MQATIPSLPPFLYRGTSLLGFLAMLISFFALIGVSGVTPVHAWVVPNREIEAGDPVLEDLGIISQQSFLWTVDLPIGTVISFTYVQTVFTKTPVQPYYHHLHLYGRFHFYKCFYLYDNLHLHIHSFLFNGTHHKLTLRHDIHFKR